MKPDNIPTPRPSVRSGMEWFDSILSGGILKQLGLYAATIFIVYVLCVFVIWICGGTLAVSHQDFPTLGGSMRGVLYYFFDAGNLHTETSASAKILSPIVSFLGMVLLSGLLITTLSNIVERRVENVAKGLVTYRGIRDHYVIVGYGEITVCLLRDIFKRAVRIPGMKNLPKVLILTSQDVQQVRAQVQSQLPEYEERNVLFYSGSIESKEHIGRLNINTAREVYILGEAEEHGRDSKNLECVRMICELRSEGSSDKEILTVNVQFDRPSSYSIIKKLDIPDNYVYKDGKQVLYFRPFNFFENWARLLWGYYRKNDYDVLDFDPEAKGGSRVLCEGSDRHVHLVIVGFNRMGRALLLEALRICHYPNYDEKSGANKTRITVVDAEMNGLLPQFESQYPYIREIADVEIDYRNARVEDSEVRTLLECSAADERELLTVAVCLRDPDTSLATGLSLPESLYCKSDEKGIANNDKVRILIRQELQKGIGTILKADEHKYKHVKIFGMLTEGISHELLDDTAAMWVNAYYDLKYAPMEGTLKRPVYDAYIRYLERHGLRNTDVLALAAMPAHRVEAERTARRLWYLTGEDFRFSNRYQTEMYDIYKRYAECTSPESLYRMEHLRWCADRRIIGYRAAEIKNMEFKTHHLLVPYNDLPNKEKNKDREVVKNRESIEELCKKLQFYTCVL